MMFRLLIIFAVIGVTLVSPVSSVELTFYGSPPGNSRDIEKIVARAIDPAFTMLDSIASDLVSRGYLDATIEIRSGNIIIKAGSKYYLSSLIFRSDTITKVEIVLVPFDSANVSNLITKALQKFQETGYLYASTQTKRILIEDSLVSLELDINLGPRVEIGEQIFAGLSRTDPDLISNYVPSLSGQNVTPDLIKKVETAALSIPFLTFQPPAELAPRPGYIVSDMVLNFLERTPVSFKGAAGISGEEKNTVWSFDLALNNLFGSGKKVEISSDKRESGRNSLRIQYSQPSFMLGTGELKFEVLTRNYRDEFYEFDISGGYSAKLNSRFTTGIKLGWKSVVPEFGNQSYKTLSSQFAISRRTHQVSFNPDNGFAMSWAIDFRFRKYSSDSVAGLLSNNSLNETRNNISISYLTKLTGPFIWLSKINYEGLETKESLPPLSELVLIGGPGTLRGYRNEQFSSIRAVYGTIEPRLRFGSGFGYLFYDAAYLNNRQIGQNSKIGTIEDFKYGYGLGIGVGSNFRSVLLSFGWEPKAGFDQPRLSIELSSDI